VFYYKTIILPKLKSHKLTNQKTEAANGIQYLNTLTALGMPVSVKID